MGLRPAVIGITGGVASGKSFVAREFARRGAEVIDVDRLGHEVLLLPDIQRAVRQHFGDEVFSTDGQIDRRRLGERVFAPTAEGREELRYLESLTHPRIRRILDERVAAMRGRGEVSVVIVDAPLLVEAGWNEFCDKVIFVDAPREVRLARALERGWSTQEFGNRESRQESCQVKRQGADMVLHNGGSEESTRSELERVWNELNSLRHDPMV